MKLYDFGRSGNCYKIRLFLSLIGLSHETVTVDLSRGEHREPWFLAINPEACVPVIDDDGTVLHDSAAILVYLAEKYADGNWLPKEALTAAMVTRWLVFEQGMMRYGLARGRSISLNNPIRLAGTGSLDECHRIGTDALDLLEAQLSQTTWLVGNDHPTIADVACYPYSLLAPDAGLSLEAYPAIMEWFGNIETLPGYRPM